MPTPPIQIPKTGITSSKHMTPRFTEADFEAIDAGYNEIQNRIRAGSLPAGSGRHFLAIRLPNQEDNTAYVRWWAKRMGKELQQTRPMTKQVFIGPRAVEDNEKEKGRVVGCGEVERVERVEVKAKGVSGEKGEKVNEWELVSKFEGEGRVDCWVGVEDELEGPYVLLG